MSARDTVRPGETVVGLASRLLGDGLRWPELVALNRLVPPYLSADGLPGTLAPGAEILYPLTASAAPPRDLSALEEETYGRDLASTGRGDLILSAGGLVTVAGLANLQDALLRRVRVSLGAHPFHPAYGSNVKSHLGRAADDARLLLMIDDVTRAVKRDPRVLEATGSAGVDADVVSVLLSITPIPPGTPFSLRVPLSPA